MLRGAVLLAVAAALVAPSVATAAEYVKPCHGDTYRWGALIWHPTRGEYVRACIEQ